MYFILLLIDLLPLSPVAGAEDANRIPAHRETNCQDAPTGLPNAEVFTQANLGARAEVASVRTPGYSPAFRSEP